MVGIILLLPVVLNRFLWLTLRASYVDRLKIRYKMTKGIKNEEDKVISNRKNGRTVPTRKNRRGSLRSGYAFSQEQGYGDLITKGKIFKRQQNLPILQNGPSTSRDLPPVHEHPL
uniref:Uncharacterized protein n=1 Tax=Acrobeloides nanus TaxID=290746 RepID=A0A914DD25_9BILA